MAYIIAKTINDKQTHAPMEINTIASRDNDCVDD